MLGTDFYWILCIKTATLKMLSLYTSKILLTLNNSLVCSNLPLLNNAKHLLLLAIYFFSSLLCKCSPKRCCHSLYNCEYTISKVIIMTPYLRMALLWLIDQCFLQFFSMFFICGFRLRLSFKKTARNFDSVRTNSRLFIFSFGKTSGISFFGRFFGKRVVVGFFHIKHSHKKLIFFVIMH